MKVIINDHILLNGLYANAEIILEFTKFEGKSCVHIRSAAPHKSATNPIIQTFKIVFLYTSFILLIFNTYNDINNTAVSIKKLAGNTINQYNG